MKILLAGHTGTEKKQVYTKLEECLPRFREDWANRIKVVDLEDCIDKAGGGDPRLFAGVRHSHEQRKRWLDGWGVAKQELAESGAHCEILCLHLSFATRGNRFCPADIASLLDWGPDLIITLVDDIYSVKRRIQLKRFTFSLAQLYDWRTTEQMIADQIGILGGARRNASPEARNVAHCESLHLAVKTPLITAVRLIAHPEAPRCYASFPISSTRDSVELKEEINAFRRRMHQIMPTFDPLTIEEKPFIDFYDPEKDTVEYDPSEGPPGREAEEGLKRWDARLGEDDLAPLVWEPDVALNTMGQQEDFFPVALKREEFEELFLPEEGEGYTTVDDHVEFRDIRLVAQADLVVCWRPYMGGHVTGGVNTEIETANMLSKQVVAFVGDDKLRGKPLRAHINTPIDKEHEFWAHLEEEAKKHVRIPRRAYY